MLLDFIARAATFQSLGEKAVSSVLLLFLLLMARSWVAVFLLIIWSTGQWLRVVFVLSPPAPPYGGQRCRPKLADMLSKK